MTAQRELLRSPYPRCPQRSALVSNDLVAVFLLSLGAYTTSITAGLLIVSSLHGSSAESTSKHQVSPVEDILVGLLCLAVAWCCTGRDEPFREPRRNQERRKAAGSARGGQADVCCR